MHKISLKNWVILLTVLPTALIGFTLAGYFSYSRSAELDDFLNLRAQSIIEPLALAAKMPLSNNNREQLRQLISFAHRSQSSIVKTIAIFTLDNQIFITSAYHGDTNKMRLKAGQKLPSYTIAEELNDFIIYRTPIIDENKKNSSSAPLILGYIAVHIDKSSIKFNQQNQYIIALTLALFGVLLSIIFARRLIHNVAKPVDTMVEAIDRIREDKLESRVSGKFVGELNFLKKGINAIAEKLGNNNNDMQGKIDQATIDFRENAEQLEIQNVELSIAKKKAQEANKIKSEFLANMSHELRTPLNGVIGFTRQVLKTPLSGPQRDYLQTIDRSANNLLTIINDILDFSKLEAGKMVIESIPFSLREAIDDSLVLLAPSAHKKNIELSINIDKSIPDSLLGDAMRIKQIMSNLVGNAIKFTQEGSVMIEVTHQNNTAKHATIKIMVVDTGIGMSDEQQQTIFSSFSQADQSITRLYGGSGLGLVICQRLAFEMKGDVGFSSDENQGSSFWFSFECEVNSLSLSNELDTQQLANKTILYYEPHPHTRAATCDILSQWNMQITCVQSIAALNQAVITADKKVSFEYALIGHDNSSTALSELKKTIAQIKPHIEKIHLAMNSNSPSLQEALISCGALSCLSKPITASKLNFSLLSQEYNQLDSKNKILPIKVLAVDDNEANLKLINALLLEQVSEVVLAENGIKAIELCKSETFALIFMDIQMPVMDGITTLKKIKSETINGKTPIIAVTAHALSGEKEKMQQQGFNAYMTKPIDETMLCHIIYEYCDLEKAFSGISDGKIKQNHQQLGLISANTNLTIQSAVIDWPLSIQRAAGKEDLAKEMLAGLVDSLADNEKYISQALIDEDINTLKQRIHQLNGSCCYTGVPSLHNICQYIETKLKTSNSLADLEPEFLELFEQIELVLAEANKLFDSLDDVN
ncbi:MAG: two-component sensor histidine kinase BarA [Litorilituus sp.]|jgi:two-component system sensor histidine kinase BarA|nr:two-component sensor histidine kinase BarA [Litorilituus sp.]